MTRNSSAVRLPWNACIRQLGSGAATWFAALILVMGRGDAAGRGGSGEGNVHPEDSGRTRASTSCLFGIDDDMGILMTGARMQWHTVVCLCLGHYRGEVWLGCRTLLFLPTPYLQPQVRVLLSSYSLFLPLS
jgi:hypothetical protein